MKLLPIKLGVARPIGKAKAIKTGAPKQGSGSSVGIPKELKAKIHQRDDNCCRFCGFQSKKYQNITFLNSNTGDMRPQNMATSCIFCHQCMNLQDVSIMRSGVLIWLPELTQAQLHHIARAIYVARISQGAIAEAARKSLDTLMGRRESAKERLDTDDPYILSLVMKDYLTDKQYHLSRPKLDGIRLFPLDRRIVKESDLEFNQFPQILAYWRSKDGPFGGKTPQQWVGLYHDMRQKVAS